MRILLIDDQTLFREGFKLMLERLLPAPLFITEATSMECAQSMFGHALWPAFDLIFLDLGLPGLNGMDALKAVRQAASGVCTVVLSGVESDEVVRQALLYGAQGYIPKSISLEAMREAIALILDGQIYMPADMARVETRPGLKLTARQVEVLAELCVGRTNKEIAEQLGMTENTVRVHLTETFRRMGVRSRTEAALLAKRWGLF